MSCDSATLQCLARLEAATGDTAQARRLFKRAIKADPAHVWSYQVQNFSRQLLDASAVLMLWRCAQFFSAAGS